MVARPSFPEENIASLFYLMVGSYSIFLRALQGGNPPGALRSVCKSLLPLPGIPGSDLLCALPEMAHPNLYI